MVNKTESFNQTKPTVTPRKGGAIATPGVRIIDGFTLYENKVTENKLSQIY